MLLLHYFIDAIAWTLFWIYRACKLFILFVFIVMISFCAGAVVDDIKVAYFTVTTTTEDKK